MVFMKLLIITILIVAVCADFNWYGQTGFPGFGQAYNNIPNPQPFPTFGQQFPNFPSFPNTNFPAPNFPNMNFPAPNFPNLNFPPLNFPTGVDISKVTPAPGATYNGIAVQSVSEVKRDKDGNLIKNGGTTVITNRDGEVHKYETGENPPKMDVNPTFQYQYPTFNPPDFSKFKPSENSQYSSVSSSSSSSSSDVNGVKKSGGAIYTSVDVNGEKKEQSYIFGDGV